MRPRRFALSAALLFVYLLLSGCSLFKPNKCDCPKWDLVPTPERNYDVHGEVAEPSSPYPLPRGTNAVPPRHS